MKLGINTYSYRRELIAGKTDILTVLERIAALGAVQAELVPDTPTYKNGWSATEELIPRLLAKAKDLHLEFSSYTIGAEFVTSPQRGGAEISPEEFRAEVARVKKEVEIAARLGCTRMRHDVAFRPKEQCTYAQFEKDLPLAVDACGEVADHAAKYGIVTSIENHGLHFQGSERVTRLVLAVGRDNFRTTVDVGNFVCVDEDPVVAVRNNMPIASMLHIKDWYIRKRVANPEGWAPTPHGYFRRPATPGDGDLDLFAIAEIVRASGYDGYASLEYESAEAIETGIPRGFTAIRNLLG